MSFVTHCQHLEAKIEAIYVSGLSIDEAEKLAAELLHIQFALSEALKKVDLDARMRKSGVKAIRAAIYMEASTKTDKKPTEAALASIVDMSKLVQDEQKNLDEAEVERDHLKRLNDIFINGHIFCRGVAKGGFSG